MQRLSLTQSRVLSGQGPAYKHQYQTLLKSNKRVCRNAARGAEQTRRPLAAAGTNTYTLSSRFVGIPSLSCRLYHMSITSQVVLESSSSPRTALGSHI